MVVLGIEVIGWVKIVVMTLKRYLVVVVVMIVKLQIIAN